MPMNDEVRKAVEECAAQGCESAAETIRAELTRLYAIADSVDPLVVRLGEVTRKLADYENASKHAADDCVAKDAEIARLQEEKAEAVTDARRWRVARNNTGDGLRLIRWDRSQPEELQVMFPSPALCDSDADAAIHNSAREACE